MYTFKHLERVYLHQKLNQNSVQWRLGVILCVEKVNKLLTWKKTSIDTCKAGSFGARERPSPRAHTLNGRTLSWFSKVCWGFAWFRKLRVFEKVSPQTASSLNLSGNIWNSTNFESMATLMFLFPVMFAFRLGSNQTLNMHDLQMGNWKEKEVVLKSLLMAGIYYTLHYIK